MESRIEIRNGKRYRIDTMRRSADGNTVSEFVQPLDDEPGDLIHNQPDDPRFVRDDIQNAADVSKLPTLAPPGSNIVRNAVPWPDRPPVQNSSGEDLSRLPTLVPPTYQPPKRDAKQSSKTVQNATETDDGLPPLVPPGHRR